MRVADCEEALGRGLNVGHHEEVSITALARRVIELTDSSSSIRYVPYGEAYPEGFEELGRRRPSTVAIQERPGWRPPHD